jgi:hypothetical protein
VHHIKLNSVGSPLAKLLLLTTIGITSPSIALLCDGWAAHPRAAARVARGQNYRAEKIDRFVISMRVDFVGFDIRMNFFD